LDSEIRTFKAKYIVLPGFLSDASMKIDTTVNRILNGNRSEHLAVACHRFVHDVLKISTRDSVCL